MSDRKLTPGYIFFFLLFWPDTWRIVIGVVFAILIGSSIVPSDLGAPGSWLFYIMLATIGYSLAAIPARGITRLLKKAILGDRLPR